MAIFSIWLNFFWYQHLYTISIILLIKYCLIIPLITILRINIIWLFTEWSCKGSNWWDDSNIIKLQLGLSVDTYGDEHTDVHHTLLDGGLFWILDCEPKFVHIKAKIKGYIEINTSNTFKRINTQQHRLL